MLSAKTKLSGRFVEHVLDQVIVVILLALNSLIGTGQFLSKLTLLQMSNPPDALSST